MIKTGGKQERVEQGQRLNVELLGAATGDDVDLAPVLVVDGGTVLSAPSDLRGARVTGRVVGLDKGPKIHGFTYKNKSRGRKSWGHRQKYTTVEITSITREG